MYGGERVRESPDEGIQRQTRALAETGVMIDRLATSRSQRMSMSRIRQATVTEYNQTFFVLAERWKIGTGNPVTEDESTASD